MLFFYISLFIISCLSLVFSGGIVVRSLTQIARFLRWREFVVAFVFMAFATSIPELFIGITSALHKIPELSFGNIIGANVINLSLAIGLVVLVTGTLEIEKVTVLRNSFFTAIYALLPLLLILDGDLSRIDGVVLLLSFGFYLTWLFDQKEKFTKVYDQTEEKKPPETLKERLKLFVRNIGIFWGGVILILLSSEGIIRSTNFLAGYFDVSFGIIGLLLLGAGTALPEVYFSIRAAKSGYKAMVLGNLMGCVVITSSLVLGIVALIFPIKITDFSPFAIARVFLLISVALFIIFLRTRDKITKREAIILTLVYIFFVIFEGLR